MDALFGGEGDGLGIPAEGLGAVRAVREGLPVEAVEQVQQGGRLSLAEIDRLILPRKTLDHRRKLGRLTPDQSDRLMRVARLLALAEDTFGPDRARLWLRRPTSALEGEAPLDLLDTDAGARAVETVIGRIAHGIAA